MRTQVIKLASYTGEKAGHLSTIEAFKERLPCAEIIKAAVQALRDDRKCGI